MQFWRLICGFFLCVRCAVKRGRKELKEERWAREGEGTWGKRRRTVVGEEKEVRELRLKDKGRSGDRGGKTRSALCQSFPFHLLDTRQRRKNLLTHSFKLVFQVNDKSVRGKDVGSDGESYFALPPGDPQHFGSVVGLWFPIPSTMTSQIRIDDERRAESMGSPTMMPAT